MTKKNIIISVIGILILGLLLNLFFRLNKPLTFERQNIPQKARQYVLPSQDEIESDAIESYLYIATLQAFQIAQSAGVDSKEYRDYEQRYSEYRTFRDARVKKMLERNMR